MNRNKEQPEEVPIKFRTLLKRLWPSYIVQNSVAFTLAVIYINVLIFSNIIWPGEPFHALEIGLLAGIGAYVVAFSGILFGFLADKYSRVKLMAFTQIIYGISYFLNGFVAEGLGFTTFMYFFLFTLIRGFASGGFWPTTNSYVDDMVEEGEKSAFFGSVSALFQVFEMTGMVISAILFQMSLWRLFVWFTGGVSACLGIIILIRAKEPKRGISRKELKGALSNDDVSYEYKLNKETFRTTILSPTNIIAFIEGFFTTVLIAIPDFLLVPFLQSPPFNISPFSTSIVMIIFGLPGTLIGSLALSKYSDKLAKKNIKNRVYLIAISMFSLFVLFSIIFYLPLPSLTPAQGNNLGFLFSISFLWIMGLLALFSRVMMSVWSINQPPVLQAINLPEAQGKITSWNQFLEHIGYGTGPIVAGILLAIFSNNYQITVTVSILIGINGAFLWILAAKWVNKDVERISNILKERGAELSNTNQENRE